MITISSMSLQLANGTSTTLVPKTSQPLQPKGTLYYVKNYYEAGALAPWPTGVANFSALGLYPEPKSGTGGQQAFVVLKRKEIDLVKSINAGMPCSWQKAVQLPGEGGSFFRWDNQPDGSLYSIDEQVRWPRVALAGDGTRNMVSVLERAVDPATGQAFRRVEGVPQSADYSLYASCPWFIMTSFNCYSDHHVGTEAQFKIVLWDPSSGFEVSTDARGLWIDERWLAEPVAPDDTGPITHERLAAGEQVAHLYRIDLAKVMPFVTPALGTKLTPAAFAARYNMDFAINGDQGPWLLNLLRALLTGSLTSTGRWMSNGKWISQSTAESSIWFSQSGACRIAYAKPASFTPWNIVSGPKAMLLSGIPQKPSYDDTFLAARSAFGLFDATHAAAIAVEGNEGTPFGATEQDLLELGLQLQLRDLLELDSGGSTGCFHRNGVSYSVEDRNVLNALCFKVK